jgi:hypothetical protein
MLVEMVIPSESDDALITICHLGCCEKKFIKFVFLDNMKFVFVVLLILNYGIKSVL